MAHAQFKVAEDRFPPPLTATYTGNNCKKPYVQRGVAGKLSVHMDVLEKLSDEVIKKYEVRDPPPPAEIVG